MGQCTSAKSKRTKKQKESSQNDRDEFQNQLEDKQVIDHFKDFQVFKINPSCGYTFLQRYIQLISKDPSSAKEYEFLKVDNNSQAIAFSQYLKPFMGSEVDDKILKVIFDFKDVIIHNNSNQSFDDQDSTHPICKLIGNFKQKNVKPKTINILYDNQIIDNFTFLSDQELCQKFICPVLVLDNNDPLISTPKLSKQNWIGSKFFIHSRKQYMSNSNKYEENLDIRQKIFLYKNAVAAQALSSNETYFDMKTEDISKQQKLLQQVSDNIANNYRTGQNTLLIHENNDKKSITYVLLAISSILTHKLGIKQSNIINFWENRLPKGIFENFKQEVASQEAKELTEKQSKNTQQKEQDNKKNEKIQELELSNIQKIENILKELLIESQNNVQEFDKVQFLIQKLIQNIINQFDKKEYRILNKSNQNLQIIFKYKNGQKLINIIGFIDQQDNKNLCQNQIDDIAYFKSIKSDYSIALKNFSQSNFVQNLQRGQ